MACAARGRRRRHRNQTNPVTQRRRREPDASAPARQRGLPGRCRDDPAARRGGRAGPHPRAGRYGRVLGLPTAAARRDALRSRYAEPVSSPTRRGGRSQDHVPNGVGDGRLRHPDLGSQATLSAVAPDHRHPTGRLRRGGRPELASVDRNAQSPGVSVGPRIRLLHRRCFADDRVRQTGRRGHIYRRCDHQRVERRQRARGNGTAGNRAKSPQGADGEAVAKECGQSRVWAGVHFPAAADEGRRLGSVIAARAAAAVPPLH